MPNENISEKIQQLLRDGNPMALDLLWDSYGKDLFGFLCSLLHNRHHAEDVLQDVFVTIARKPQAVSQARRLKPYLFQLARNQALNFMKRHQPERTAKLDPEAVSWLATDPAELEAGEQTKELSDALAQLPEKQRSVVVLKSLQEKTFKEVSECLNISINTAASRYRYGLNRLKELLGGDTI